MENHYQNIIVISITIFTVNCYLQLYYYCTYDNIKNNNDDDEDDGHDDKKR